MEACVEGVDFLGRKGIVGIREIWKNGEYRYSAK